MATDDLTLLRGAASSVLDLLRVVGESLLLAWWQLLAVVGGGIVLFAAAYLGFLRQEVRA